MNYVFLLTTALSQANHKVVIKMQSQAYSVVSGTIYLTLVCMFAVFQLSEIWLNQNNLYKIIKPAVSNYSLFLISHFHARMHFYLYQTAKS